MPKKEGKKKKSIDFKEAQNGLKEMNKILSKARKLSNKLSKDMGNEKLPSEKDFTDIEDLLKKVKDIKIQVLKALILIDWYNHLAPIDDLIDQAKNLAISLRVVSGIDTKETRSEIKKLLIKIMDEKEKLEKKLPKPKGKKFNMGFYIMNRWLEPMVKHYVDSLSSKDLETMINKTHEWKGDAIKELEIKIGDSDLFSIYWKFRNIDNTLAQVLDKFDLIKNILGWDDLTDKEKIDTLEIYPRSFIVDIDWVKMLKDRVEKVLPKE